MYRVYSLVWQGGYTKSNSRQGEAGDTADHVVPQSGGEEKYERQGLSPE